MVDQEARQSIAAEEHLKVLSLCYFVHAGITAMMSLLGLLYVFMGLVFLAGGAHAVPPNGPPPTIFGVFFICIGLGVVCIGVVIAILKIVVGMRIRQRKARIFCMIVAGIGCLQFPYGTLLGVFTFIVLGRSSVRQLFESTKTDDLPPLSE